MYKNEEKKGPVWKDKETYTVLKKQLLTCKIQYIVVETHDQRVKKISNNNNKRINKSLT